MAPMTSIRPPTDFSLPFFAYGLFRPGQLGFSRIREYAETFDASAAATGDLLHRDGLPILVAHGGYHIGGTLIWFTPGRAEEAYTAIGAMEPEKLYRWETMTIEDCGGTQVRANVLVGVKPMRGTGGERIHPDEWDGRHDPLFTTALDVVQETLQANQVDDGSLRPLFRLQMAYLLLWSAIERYASLRYNLGEDVTRKICSLADEPAFQDALKHKVRGGREVYSAKAPEDKFVLDSQNPKRSLDYYYQVRSNITHRGKGVNRDFEIVKSSLEELLPIFREVLTAAFQDAETNPHLRRHARSAMPKN
jgi:hypothetical protein